MEEEKKEENKIEKGKHKEKEIEQKKIKLEKKIKQIKNLLKNIEENEKEGKYEIKKMIEIMEEIKWTKLKKNTKKWWKLMKKILKIEIKEMKEKLMGGIEFMLKNTELEEIEDKIKGIEAKEVNLSYFYFSIKIYIHIFFAKFL